MSEIQTALAARADYQQKNDEAYAVLTRIRNQHGYQGAEQHTDAVEAYAVSRAAYERAEALSPVIIRANLADFGVKDLEVTVQVLTFQSNDLAVERKMMLSDACGLRCSGVAKAAGMTPPLNTQLHLNVFMDGEMIGVVDSDGDFNYDAAPDLRSALVWKLATDGGRDKLLKGLVDVEKAIEEILACLTACGIDHGTFFGPYADIVKKVFDYKKGSRFGDGHMGARNPLWRGATRELGSPHKGFSFSY